MTETGDQQRTLHAIPALLHHVLGQVGGLRAKTHDRTSTAWEAPLPFHVDAFDDANDLWALLAATARAASALLGRPFPVRTTLPTGTTPAAGRAEAAKTTAWLERHLEQLDGLYELDALLAAARSIAARHPLNDRTTTSKTAVCPDDRGTLTIRPPRFVGDLQQITCATCGRTFTETEHDDTSTRFAVVEAHAKAAARATAVRARLAAKYRLSA